MRRAVDRLEPDRWLSTLDPGDAITFNSFSPDVQAIGGFFFPTDDIANPVSGEITLTVTEAGGASTDFKFTADASENFRGFVSSSGFISLKAAPTSNDQFVTVNDLTLAIPEPGTLVLMTVFGLGLGGGVALRKRRELNA